MKIFLRYIAGSLALLLGLGHSVAHAFQIMSYDVQLNHPHTIYHFSERDKNIVNISSVSRTFITVDGKQYPWKKSVTLSSDASENPTRVVVKEVSGNMFNVRPHAFEQVTKADHDTNYDELYLAKDNYLESRLPLNKILQCYADLKMYQTSDPNQKAEFKALYYEALRRPFAEITGLAVSPDRHRLFVLSRNPANNLYHITIYVFDKEEYDHLTVDGVYYSQNAFDCCFNYVMPVALGTLATIGFMLWY